MTGTEANLMRCDKESNGRKGGKRGRARGTRFHLDQRCEERADRAKGSTGESGLPPLWQFSVSCRIPTHWKLRNTEEAQKGYGFEIKRTSVGDADTGDYSVTLSPPPRENKLFFPLRGGDTRAPRQRCRHRTAALFGLWTVPVPGHRARLRFFREFFAGLCFVLRGKEPRVEQSKVAVAGLRFERSLERSWVVPRISCARKGKSR